MAQICTIMVTFLFQPILVDIFVTIVMVKVKLIPDVYTWAIDLITNKKKLVKNNFYFFASSGGKIAP